MPRVEATAAIYGTPMWVTDLDLSKIRPKQGLCTLHVETNVGSHISQGRKPTEKGCFVPISGGDWDMVHKIILRPLLYMVPRSR